MLEKHTWSLASVSLTNQIKTIKCISDRLAEDPFYMQSSDMIDINSQKVFKYKWDYLPPLGEKTECVLIALLKNLMIANIMSRTGPDIKGFKTSLEFDRNVKIDFSSDSDSHANEINTQDLEAFLEETINQ